MKAGIQIAHKKATYDKEYIDAEIAKVEQRYLRMKANNQNNCNRTKELHLREFANRIHIPNSLNSDFSFSGWYFSSAWNPINSPKQ
jgi:hypothetical protein